MFENLLAQDEIRERLKSDIVLDRLPPALLFTGPPGSGKITAALELARAISCQTRPEAGGAAWNCACPSCTRHRVLAHPDTLLFGPRSFPEEIAAAVEMIERSWSLPALFFFVRAVRKLLRRFDSVLFAGEESRLSKGSLLVREIEEELGLFTAELFAAERLIATRAPSRADQAESHPAAPGPAILKSAASVASACMKLEALLPDMPPVFMVRNVESWCRLAPFGKRKTVIIENADRMQDSSRNALLKILEEPPESVRFVLVTPRRGSVLATILSRSRTYPFKARSPDEASLVISRIFRSDERRGSVEEFLAARRTFTPEKASGLALDFIGAVLRSVSATRRLDPPMIRLASATDRSATGAEVLASILDATGEFGAKDEKYAGSFESFLGALLRGMSTLLAGEGVGPYTVRLAGAWSELVRDAWIQQESYNRSPSLLAQTLMYAMEAAS